MSGEPLPAEVVTGNPISIPSLCSWVKPSEGCRATSLTPWDYCWERRLPRGDTRLLWLPRIFSVSLSYGILSGFLAQ